MGPSETPQFLDGGRVSFYSYCLGCFDEGKTFFFFNVGGDASFYSYSYRFEKQCGSFCVVAVVLSFEVLFAQNLFLNSTVLR